eukprot:TRINITY_DN5679_c0_g1_i2.p1 TRINITY_DN5679_c0_g1~~TRINITY_DN5679_c0_g1_i2.p1  ORF type:complete len:191 (+),score=14.30 TRINITY_DN5679_c0_g1_i2:60-575(+)
MTRLVQQLADLDEFREDFDDEEEYEETKQDTIEQLQEFKVTLQKMMAGNMTLVSELGAMKLAIQAAISKAFKTPEVIKLFAKKQPGQLRTRLGNLERMVKLNKLSKETYTEQAVEILTALRKLGEKLTPAEASLIASHSTKALQEFERVEEDFTASSILATASSDVKKAET